MFLNKGRQLVGWRGTPNQAAIQTGISLRCELGAANDGQRKIPEPRRTENGRLMVPVILNAAFDHPTAFALQTLCHTNGLYK